MPAPGPDPSADADPAPFAHLTCQENKVLAAHLMSG